MKTASVQHINNVIQPRIYASYEIQVSTITNIYEVIMKKLTNVSPFIMLLVPVFVLMLLSINSVPENAQAKIVRATEVSKVSGTSDATLK